MCHFLNKFDFLISIWNPINLQAETLFRNRMHKMLEDYKTFDPEKYVKDVIAWYEIFYT